MTAYIVKTFHGLEHILAQEIQALGGRNVRAENRAVSCLGDLKFGYRLNYLAHTAISVLRPIKTGKIRSEQDLYALVSSVKWYDIFDVRKTILVRVVCYSDLFSNSHYLTLKAKDAIVDQFRDKFHRRPSIDKNPDIKIDLFIKNDRCTISLDLSGSPLFKRGYRMKTGDAPLNEVLAAGMIRLTGWNPQQPLIDPMCGAGTIPIEAHLFASGRSPHFLRQAFSLQHLNDFDRRLWNLVKEEVSEISGEAPTILGADKDAGVLRMARSNARNAGITQIKWRSKDFFTMKRPEESGLLIFNPPYDERIKLPDAIHFYQQIGDHLKRNWTGWQAFILSAHHQAIKHIGLKPAKKLTLFNGPLECRFLGFELY